MSDNIVEWVPAEGFVCVRNVFNVSRHTQVKEKSHSATSLKTRSCTFCFGINSETFKKPTNSLDVISKGLKS